MSTETIRLTEAETDALKAMYNGEDEDDSTALRWVATEIGDEWRHGHRYHLVVTHADHEGLWGIRVRQVEGDEPSDDLGEQTTAVLKRVWAVPSVTYTFTEPTPAA